MSWQPGTTLAQMEKKAVEEALRFYGGNKTAAAQSLGIAIKTLYNKLDAYAEEDAKLKSETDSRIAKAKEDQERFRKGAPIAHTLQASRGMDVQPVTQNSTQPSMPLSEREEVQEVSSSTATRVDKRRSSKHI